MVRKTIMTIFNLKLIFSCALVLLSSQALAKGSIADDAYGTYSANGCEQPTDQSLVVTPGALIFYESHCEITSETLNGMESSLSLLCSSEGEEYEVTAEVSAYMNGNLLVETSEGMSNIYEFCSDSH